MRPVTRQAYTPEEALPGGSTFRTDKSKDGLPTDQDREKEVNLPPGAATPNSPKEDDAAPGNGRVLKSPSFNGPGTGEPGPAEHPRTLPTPGEDSPTKFDYGMPTRRTMTSGEDRVAYKPRIPWRRQRRQRVFKKLKDQRYYKRNKARTRQRLKIWYKSVKRNQNFRTRKEKRRDEPERFKRRKVGDVDIECEGTVAKEAYTPWSLGKKRHRIRGPAHVHRHQTYVRNRAKAHRQHHIWYQKNRSKPAFRRRQTMRRRNPSRFKLRLAGYVPGTDIWFAYGPKATVAMVTSVTDGIVAFEDEGTDVVHHLTPQAFLQAVSFLSEEDLHEMMSVLDEWGGPDPYGDPTLQDLLDVAVLYGVSADDLLAEEVPLEDAVLDLAEDAMEMWDVDPEMTERVASAWLRRATGEILLYDQRSPEDGNWEEPESLPPATPRGPGQWTKSNPGPTHDPSPGGVPDPDTTGFPGGSGKVIPENMKMSGGPIGVVPDADSEAAYLRLVAVARSKYKPAVKGFVRMWGDLLYLVYHQIPPGRLDAATAKRFVKLCEDYEKHPAGREDIMDWVTDARGCPEDGVLTCPRRVITDMLAFAAGLVRTDAPLLVRRTGREVPGDYASYTIVEGGYDTDVGGGGDHTVNAYLLPEGYPVIVGHGLADDWELILKLDPGVKKVGHGRTAATIQDIERETARDVLDRARGVRVRLSRADTKNGIWTFRATGSKGKAYTIRVKAEAKGNTKDVAKLQVKVSCDCDFFRFQGPEHWAKSNGYLYGKPRGTASAPTEKDPKGKHWACKHLMAALSLARRYRVAGEGSWWPSGADVVPEFGALVQRVADRYGGHE